MLPDVEDLDDVRVRQRAAMRASSRNMSTNSALAANSGRMRLMTKSFSKPAMPRCLREEDLGHAARGEPLEQGVLAEGGGDQRLCRSAAHATGIFR